MKYLRQLCIILGFSFTGELLAVLIPLPIPASFYGLILFFVALSLQIVPLEAVRETGNLLLSILPVLFIPAVVRLLDIWDVVQPFIIQICILIVVSTFLTFVITGVIAQRAVREEEDEATND